MVENGVIPFARFMELALYCPVCGYYETKRDSTGRRGDFYTSVSVGNLFGELLAFQFAGWLEELPEAESRGRIVEIGAHDGKLAADILRCLRERRPELFHATEYWIIEPSARRREWQQETLSEFAPQIRWLSDLSAVSENPKLSGIIFSNELLDALPVRRLGWDARERQWFEWGVTMKDGRFIWKRMPTDGKCKVRSAKSEVGGLLPKVPLALLEVLPDGYIVEVSDVAEKWWHAAASVLQNGKLLTFDYGLSAEELFAPERLGGTLRAYYRHRHSDDVLTNVGEQDMTAHVNFGVIQAAGEATGLRTEAFQTQAQFLTDIARRAWEEGSAFGPWTAQHTRQFQTLTHPEHFGRAFRVLVQSR